mmetsp:Transcript_59238/g.105725  ORF Transcript_59238/g.105725 Transcript_59238/m.105725 type:complete len:299 (+) Transcript_59238:1486-2382(+)
MDEWMYAAHVLLDPAVLWRLRDLCETGVRKAENAAHVGWWVELVVVGGLSLNVRQSVLQGLQGTHRCHRELHCRSRYRLQRPWCTLAHWRLRSGISISTEAVVNLHVLPSDAALLRAQSIRHGCKKLLSHRGISARTPMDVQLPHLPCPSPFLDGWLQALLNLTPCLLCCPFLHVCNPEVYVLHCNGLASRVHLLCHHMVRWLTPFIDKCSIQLVDHAQPQLVFARHHCKVRGKVLNHQPGAPFQVLIIVITREVFQHQLAGGSACDHHGPLNDGLNDLSNCHIHPRRHEPNELWFVL